MSLISYKLDNPSCLPRVTQNIYNEIQNYPSVSVLKKFAELNNILGIALVGSSGSGKSTLLGAIRNHYSSTDEITIPKRFVTRVPRSDDDPIENIYLSIEAFQRLSSSGMSIHWERQMDNNRKEYYGFEKTDPKKLTILSANNAFFRELDSQAEKDKSAAQFKKTLLVIGIFAPDILRKTRLEQRSPDMTSAEKECRLSDSSESIIPHCHLLIQNHGETEHSALQDIVQLVSSTLSQRLKWGQILDLGNHQLQHRSRLFDINTHEVLFSDGAIKKFEYVERSPGVRTLITDGKSILLTKEWREEINQWDIRLPGGKVFENIKEYTEFKKVNPSLATLHEKARHSAHKETQEEVGMELDLNGFHLEHVSNCGSVVKWDLYYFSAKVQQEQGRNQEMVTEESEIISNQWFTFEQVQELCLSGQISEDRTSSFLLRYIHKNK